MGRPRSTFLVPPKIAQELLRRYMEIKQFEKDNPPRSVLYERVKDDLQKKHDCIYSVSTIRALILPTIKGAKKIKVAEKLLNALCEAIEDKNFRHDLFKNSTNTHSVNTPHAGDYIMFRTQIGQKAREPFHSFDKMRIHLYAKKTKAERGDVQYEGTIYKSITGYLHCTFDNNNGNNKERFYLNLYVGNNKPNEKIDIISGLLMGHRDILATAFAQTVLLIREQKVGAKPEEVSRYAQRFFQQMTSPSFMELDPTHLESLKSQAHQNNRRPREEGLLGEWIVGSASSSKPDHVLLHLLAISELDGIISATLKNNYNHYNQGTLTLRDDRLVIDCGHDLVFARLVATIPKSTNLENMGLIKGLFLTSGLKDRPGAGSYIMVRRTDEIIKKFPIDKLDYYPLEQFLQDLNLQLKPSQFQAIQAP